MSRPITLTAIGLVLAIGVASCAQQVGIVGPETALAAPSVELPARVDNFRLITAEGYALELYRMKDASAIVMVMHGVGSSEIAQAAPELTRLQETYEARGVEFMLVNSNPKDTREAILADALKNGITAPVLQDELQLVGGQIGATRVSEAFVVDPKTWKIAYHGPLSADAIEAVVSGKAPPIASAPVTGALINFPDRSPARRAEFAKISYAATIAPLIEEKCIACHQEGGIAPFGFDGYDKVKAFAPMIREAMRTDRMPPWDPDPHVGKFRNDKSLSSDQIKTLINWIEAGAPRGDGPDQLAAVRHVAPEWPLGKPDLILDLPAYKIPATGIVEYQYPVVANPLKEGKWLKASTTRVGARQAVHHVLSGFVQEGQVGRGMAAFGVSVGGYTVGMESVVNQKGIGTWVPPGGAFGFQMHYTPFGKEVTTREQVGLYFYKDGETPDLMMREQPLADPFITLPPNDPAHRETAYFLFPKDAVLYTAVVHAHYRGTYSKLEVQYPDGKQETILNVPFYDFNWQRMYEFETPINIPAGSKVIATYIYDNSKRNPANPNPNEEVIWGDQSFEEMFYTSLRYRWVDETAATQTNYEELMARTRLLGILDDNLDNKVQETELRGPFKQQLAGGKFAFIDRDKDGGIDMTELEAIPGLMDVLRRPDVGAAPAAKPAVSGGDR